MARARLDRVEGDLEHRIRHDRTVAAAEVEGVREKVLGQAGDLEVRESGIRFADGQQPVRLRRVADRERVVA
ncbi:MAG: hypothetical protein B9S34_05365 [Opitutia bacterium Tous-C1TDCM]|nr:MAG: hypothetical protein B9S34_05365 [Opitutae bacterium Tous-C1TDCM]